MAMRGGGGVVQVCCLAREGAFLRFLFVFRKGTGVWTLGMQLGLGGGAGLKEELTKLLIQRGFWGSWKGRGGGNTGLFGVFLAVLVGKYVGYTCILSLFQSFPVFLSLFECLWV